MNVVRKLVVGALALSSAAVGAGATTVSCKDDPVAATPQVLEIGTLTSVSGDLASLGLEFTDATSLAVEDINNAGGVLDRRISLVVQDDGTSPDGARDGYAKLLASRVPIVLGPTTSGQVDAIIDLIASGNTVTIGRTTTADKLSDLADNGFFFRLAPADVHQTEQLTKLVLESNVEHLCLVHRRDTYGSSLAASVQKKLNESGRAIDITVSEYNPSSADLSNVMSQCNAFVCPNGTGNPTNDAGPVDAGDGGDLDAGASVDSGSPASCVPPNPEKVGLMLLTYVEDGALILDDAERKGWSAKKHKFFAGDGVYDTGLLTRVKNADNLEGMRGTAPAGPDPNSPEGERLRKFVARYQQRFGKNPSIFIENSFDSMYIAAIAIEIAKTAVPGVAIREAMKKVSVPGGLKVNAGDWAGIRKAIRDGQAIDFEGASGTVDFDEKGDIRPPYNYVIWKVEGGQLIAERRVTIAQ